MFGICLLVWCLGQGGPAPSGSVTFTYDIRNNTRTEQTVAYEGPWVLGGFVHQSAGHDAAFVGTLSLAVHAFKGHLSVEGGAIVATSAGPRLGTHANFMARAQLHLTNRVALVYWHWSNGNLGRRNPSVDSVGLSVRLHAWPHRARSTRTSHASSGVLSGTGSPAGQAAAARSAGVGAGSHPPSRTLRADTHVAAARLPAVR